MKRKANEKKNKKRAEEIFFFFEIKAEDVRREVKQFRRMKSHVEFDTEIWWEEKKKKKLLSFLMRHIQPFRSISIVRVIGFYSCLWKIFPPPPPCLPRFPFPIPFFKARFSFWISDGRSYHFSNFSLFDLR